MAKPAGAPSPSVVNPKRDAAIQMRNPYPILLLAALIIVLAYSLSWSLGISKPVSPSGDTGAIAAQSCTTGQTRACTSWNCTGVSTCIDGIWGGCRWEQACTPGTKETCLSESCPYGFRVCNRCGTGFGPCGPP